jgi:hypothetical protein
MLHEERPTCLSLSQSPLASFVGSGGSQHPAARLEAVMTSRVRRRSEDFGQRARAVAAAATLSRLARRRQPGPML